MIGRQLVTSGTSPTDANGLRRYWRVILPLSIVALSVGVAFSPADWIAAISGLSTVALVGVTTWYVILTRSLVQAQQAVLDQTKASEAARLKDEDARRERQAVVEVWKVCHDFVYSLNILTDALHALADESEDFGSRAESGRESLERECDEMRDVAGLLTIQSPDLPADLHLLTWKVGASLAQRAGMGLQLILAYAQARNEARDESRPLTANDVRLKWEAAKASYAALPDWHTLISGRPFAEIESDLSRLEKLAFQELRKARDGG